MLLSLPKCAVIVCATVACAAVATVGAAQTAAPNKPAAVNGSAPATKAFTPKRLPWGDPDISGNFTTKGEANTPLERPDEWAGKRIEDITPAELAKANVKRRRNALANAPFPGGGSRERGVAIAVPIHWFDNLDNENLRPWLLADPPDGKIPPLTEEGKKRAAVAGAVWAGQTLVRNGRGSADSYTDRFNSDRCIIQSILAVRALPGGYGSSHQIVQTKDYVAIRHEMIHETRVIPIAGRAAARDHNGPTLASYAGDAIAHWEGDTLVVETTNYNGRMPYRGSTPALRTVERFRRVGPHMVAWTVTIDDPQTWTRPWTIAVPWTEDDSQPIFEYACHEGNYGLRNILSAGRSDDRKGIASSDDVDAQGDLNDFE